MMKFLRSQSQLVLTIILGVIALGFLFYGSSGNLLTSTGAHVSNDYGRIDGVDLTMTDLTDAVRNTRYALIMGGREQQLNQPGMAAQIAEEAWRQLLFLREADRLHIEISDQEVLDYIHTQPVFQKDGVYSPEAYQNFISQLQLHWRIQPDAGADPLATTKAIFETVTRDKLRVNAVSGALLSTVRASAQDVSADYEKLRGEAQVSLVSLSPKTFTDTAPVTPEEIEAEYKAHPDKAEYRSKEQRKVDYVLFSLTPDQAKLAAADKKAAIEALGEKALDFAVAVTPDANATTGATPAPTPDFSSEAQKRGLATATTDFFAEDMPPANLPPSPAFNRAAFSLTKDNAISKVVEMDNGVAVLHLAAIQPSELLPLAQVSDEIKKQLQQTKGLAQEQMTAQIDAQLLKMAVEKGTDFKTAAAGYKLTVETLPPFVPVNTPQGDTRLQTIAEAVTTLTPGQVSGPVPIQSDNSTVIIHLDSRAKPDPAGLAEFAVRDREMQDQQLRGAVYVDWANWRSSQPGTRRPPDLALYGTVE